MIFLQCAFLILLMAVYWVTECIPLPVTALLPIVLLPLLSIMDTNDVCITYFKESNMMFIGNHKHDNNSHKETSRRKHLKPKHSKSLIVSIASDS